jgi:DNA-binding response OmpR family regulator
MPKRILIAEDDDEVAALLTTAFESAGYAVTRTAHGGRLPELVLQVRPDLLMLDVLLPGLDGYSLQLQFARDAATRDLPVIVATAMPAARSLFEKFPQVRLFLDKPFNTDELLTKVKEILGE